MSDTNVCPFVRVKDGMSDDEYFEALTAEVFQIIIGIKPVAARWHSIKRAFSNFSIEEISKYNGTDVERLMSDTSIIRNRKKVTATIQNAREFMKIKREYGSFAAYMRSYHGDESQLVADLDKRLHYAGAPSIRRFLNCISKQAS